MNLLFLIDNGRSIRGGTYSIFKFAEHLAKRNHKISILCNFYPGFFVNKALPDNLNICTIPHINWQLKGIGTIDSIMESIYYNLFGSKHFKTIDFVIGHQLISGIRAYRCGGKYNIKIVNFVFESPELLESTYWKQINKDKSRHNYLSKWQKFQEAMSNSTAVIANSETTLSITKKRLDSSVNISVVYPGIPNIIPISMKSKRDRVIYIGALSDAKNVNEIIKAMSFIKNPLKLIICGDGYKKQSLKSFATELNIACEFEGVVSDTEKWDLISESKFMIFPSSFEGFGLPPMEALVCGIPCICSDIPIFHEVYGDKVEYFKEHNVKQLAEKIQYLLDNPDYCKKRGSEGRKYVSEKFSWEKSAQKLEEILCKHVK